jgi:lysophospholipase L1-like esterase/chitodextrinase
MAPAAAEPSGAVVSSTDCTQNELTANDDLSTSEVHLPFGVNFYGETFQKLYVNNNGNVTFDAPLSTYTPFGLAGTNRQIIAPFFADVDTRTATGEAGSVRFGWGEAMYQGHRAFCVTWSEVGYYSNHTDKRNSFQLLLVQREDSAPGDFDIVFNYDKVQWETGDASGGSGGLGGSSAVAGFSNGSGTDGTFFQLNGSAVNGSFLDGSPTGLAVTNTNSTQLGRHVFGVRSGAAPLTKYVALGDSFQSGEGAYDYFPETDTDTNKCHRSPHAYPQRLIDRGLVGNLELSFWACSGAVIEDLKLHTSTSGAPWSDGADGKSAFDRLDHSTKLVTIGIGGNDMKFGDTLKQCLKGAAEDIFDNGLFDLFDDYSCEQMLRADVQENLRNLTAPDPTTRLTKLEAVYDEIRQRAPFARVLVVGYPRFYVEGGGSNDGTDDFCAGVRIADQRWMNSSIRTFDAAIGEAAARLGMQYVDLYDVPAGHELCGGMSHQFLNGIELQTEMPPADPGTYHPTAFGHQLITDRIGFELNALPPGDLFNVLPGQTITLQYPVNAPSVSFSTQWPGSDVVMSLRSPSGRVIERSTQAADVTHLVGPTYETYSVAAPEAGTWTVTLFGAQVAPGGEETRLVVHQTPVPNAAPVARMTQTQQGRTITVDAGASSDADGTVTEYLWEFGDGTTATGSRVTHTYATPGRYLTTLAIRDNAGGEGFTAATQTVTVSRYDFTGFFQPVDAAPAVNTMKAGRAVPIKFSLGKDEGLNILGAGSPRSVAVRCDTSAPLDELESTMTAGSNTLSYDAASKTYSYVWKTQSSWANSCRKFVLELNDGSQHEAYFRFRA